MHATPLFFCRIQFYKIIIEITILIFFGGCNFRIIPLGKVDGRVRPFIFTEIKLGIDCDGIQV